MGHWLEAGMEFCLYALNDFIMIGLDPPSRSLYYRDTFHHAEYISWL